MKSFNHQRPIRNNSGEIVGQKPAPVSRKTAEPLGGQFGRDKRKRLVVTLCAGDVIEVRPERTQRTLSITAADLYSTLLRCAASRALLERARQAKERKKETRARRQIARADAKLRRELRAERA